MNHFDVTDFTMYWNNKTSQFHLCKKNMLIFNLRSGIIWNNEHLSLVHTDAILMGSSTYYVTLISLPGPTPLKSFCHTADTLLQTTPTPEREIIYGWPLTLSLSNKEMLRNKTQFFINPMVTFPATKTRVTSILYSKYNQYW